MAMDIENVIVYSFQDSLFPELIECFGIDNAIQFVKFFGGTTLVVPSVEQIQHTMRDYDIFCRLAKTSDDSQKFEDCCLKLADEYGVTAHEIKNIFNHMGDIHEIECSRRYRGWVSRKNPILRRRKKKHE